MDSSPIALVAAMLTNGVVFTPPSELVYFAAYRNFSLHFFFILSAVNTVGHQILFELARSCAESTAGKNNRSAKLTAFLARNSKKYFERYGRRYFTVAIGRCVPGVHTGISIAAAMSDIGRLRHLIYTFIGNLIFATIIYFILSAAPKNVSDFEALAIFLTVLLVIYSLHLLEFIAWRKRQGQ